MKVYLLSGRRVMKLFRIKRILSLSFIYPYSLRFARNARKLERRDVPSVPVERIFCVPHLIRHGVLYPLLEGEVFSHLLQQGFDEELIRELAHFMASLHQKGIYFRSFHLGNVLKLTDGRLGLIDVGDMRFFPWPLGERARARNFRHLFRRADHSDLLLEYGYAKFVELYLGALGPDRSTDSLKQRLLAVHS